MVSMLTGVRTEEARALCWERVHFEPEGGYRRMWRCGVG